MKTPAVIFFLLLFHQGEAFSQIPELNQKIIDYVSSVIGKKVDRGECWDLAYQALTRNNAAWDGQYKYGQKINHSKDSVYPGDIIHFQGVMVKYSRDGLIYKETYKQHTAIVYKTYGKGHYQLAHQNTGFSGRTVGLSDMNLKDIISGKLIIYRPVDGK
jgi:hypothetical protein